MTRVALIGLGGIAQSVHLPVIQRNRAEVDLAAVVELSPSRLTTFGERYGVPQEGRFTSLDALLGAIAEGSVVIDAAIVATGGGHTDEALALIRAGVKVLVEKPLGWSSADLEALEAGLAEDGLDPRAWLRIGYMKEYDPAVAAAKSALDGLAVREVRVEVLHPADGAQLHFARLDLAADDADKELLARLGARGQRSITDATGTDDDTLRKLWSNVVLGSVVHDIALTRHLGLGLDRVLHARRVGDDFPGSVFAAGLTTEGTAWNLGWHFISDYPEYHETVTVHHERGTVQLEFATPYILNAPTKLTVATGGDQLSSRVEVQTWPQEEAFERELRALVSLAAGTPTDGSSLQEARLDQTSAQALWRACAATVDLEDEADRGTAR